MTEFERLNEMDPMNLCGFMNLIMCNTTSISRQHMFGSFIEQRLQILDPEVRKVIHGAEYQYGQYTDGRRLSRSTYQIVNRIEKFPEKPGYHYRLVIQDIRTRIIDTIEIKHYKSLSEEHGYIYNTSPVDLKPIGSYIGVNEPFYQNNSHDKHDNYMFGTNIPTAVMCDKANIEDGVLAAESLKGKLRYNEITDSELFIGKSNGYGESTLMLYMYGDENNPRVMPDLGEKIKDGVICGIRKVKPDHIASEATENALKRVNSDDDLLSGSGTIIDYEIHCNDVEALSNNENLSQIYDMYKKIQSYEKNTEIALRKYSNSTDYKLTKNARDMYHYACEYNNPDVLASASTGPFDFVRIKVFTNKIKVITEGSKITTTYGNKSVICQFVPDEEMPIDEYGNRALIQINALGIPNRLNHGQIKEQEINYAASFVQRLIHDSDDLDKQYEIISGYFKHIDYSYYESFVKYWNSLDIKNKNCFIADIVKTGIINFQHSFNNMGVEDLKRLYNKYNIRISYVKRKVRVGKKLLEKTMSSPVVISDMYFLLLKHTLKSKYSVVGVGSVNSLELPVRKSGKSKNFLPNRETNVRYGEMETYDGMNRVDPGLVNRFLAGSGMNIKHRDAVGTMLLTEDPRCYHDVDVATDDIENNIGSDLVVANFQQGGYTLYEDEFEKEVEISIRREDLQPGDVIIEE